MSFGFRAAVSVFRRASFSPTFPSYTTTVSGGWSSSGLAAIMQCKKRGAGGGGGGRSRGGNEDASSSGDLSAADVTAFERRLQTQVQSILDALQQEFASFRIGRVNTDLISGILVKANNTKQRLEHVAHVSVEDSSTLFVKPFEKKHRQELERALNDSPLNLSPIPENDGIRVPLPKVTAEHRENLQKLAAKASEESKVHLRQARHDVLSDMKKLKDAIGKDEFKRWEKTIEKVVSDSTQSIDTLLQKKKAELLK